MSVQTPREHVSPKQTSSQSHVILDPTVIFYFTSLCLLFSIFSAQPAKRVKGERVHWRTNRKIRKWGVATGRCALGSGTPECHHEECFNARPPRPPGTGALGTTAIRVSLHQKQHDSRGPDDSLVLLLVCKGCLIISLFSPKIWMSQKRLEIRDLRSTFPAHWLVAGLTGQGPLGLNSQKAFSSMNSRFGFGIPSKYPSLFEGGVFSSSALPAFLSMFPVSPQGSQIPSSLGPPGLGQGFF